MLWCLGVSEGKISIYNDTKEEFKSINLEIFLTNCLSRLEDSKESLQFITKYYDESIRKKHYEPKELRTEIDKISDLLKKTKLDLGNVEDFANSLCTGEDYYFIYAMEFNSFMDVVDSEGNLRVVSRMDSGKKVVNGVTYTMVYPEGKNYQYGNWFESPTFQYSCKDGETFLHAKKELLDFESSGLLDYMADLADYVTASRLVGVGEDCGEMLPSENYSGLATYRLNKITDQMYFIEELIIPEGVSVLDSSSFAVGKTFIKKLVLPSTVRFILPNTFDATKFGEIDMSKTGVTKLHHTFLSNCATEGFKWSIKKGKYSNLPNLYKLQLPERLMELELLNYADFALKNQGFYGVAGFYFPLILPDSVSKVRSCFASNFMASFNSKLNYMGTACMQMKEPCSSSIYSYGKGIRRVSHNVIALYPHTSYKWLNMPYALLNEQSRSFKERLTYYYEDIALVLSDEMKNQVGEGTDYTTLYNMVVYKDLDEFIDMYKVALKHITDWQEKYQDHYSQCVIDDF